MQRTSKSFNSTLFPTTKDQACPVSPSLLLLSFFFSIFSLSMHLFVAALYHVQLLSDPKFLSNSLRARKNWAVACVWQTERHTVSKCMSVTGVWLVGRCMLNNYDSLCIHVCVIANVPFHIVFGKVCTTINSLHVNVGKHACSVCDAHVWTCTPGNTRGLNECWLGVYIVIWVTSLWMCSEHRVWIWLTLDYIIKIYCYCVKVHITVNMDIQWINEVRMQLQ